VFLVYQGHGNTDAVAASVTETVSFGQLANLVYLRQISSMIVGLNHFDKAAEILNALNLPTDVHIVAITHLTVAVYC